MAVFATKLPGPYQGHLIVIAPCAARYMELRFDLEQRYPSAIFNGLGVKTKLRGMSHHKATTEDFAAYAARPYLVDLTIIHPSTVYH